MITGKKKTIQRIDELFAFVAEDADGEGVAGFLNGDGVMMPLVCADKARVDACRGIARQIARQTGEKITLVRYSVRTDLEVIEP